MIIIKILSIKIPIINVLSINMIIIKILSSTIKTIKMRHSANCDWMLRVVMLVERRLV
jgi:hypothetical protein